MTLHDDYVNNPEVHARFVRDYGECAYKRCPWPAFYGVVIIGKKWTRTLGICAWHSGAGARGGSMVPTRRERRRRPKPGLLALYRATSQRGS